MHKPPPVEAQKRATRPHKARLWTVIDTSTGQRVTPRSFPTRARAQRFQYALVIEGWTAELDVIEL